MINVILEHIFFVFMLFIISILVAFKIDDNKPVKFVEIIELWLMLTGMIYFMFLLVYLIINMGGHLAI